MRKNSCKIVIIFLFMSLFCVACAATKKEQLHNLARSIKSLRGTIKVTHRKKQTVAQQLRKNEILAGNVAIYLRNTKKKLLFEQKLLRKLYKQKGYYNNQLRIQQRDLAQQMRAIYMLGRQPVIKLLLNKQDPAEFSRIFVYYNYLQQYRLQLIFNIHNTLTKLHKNRNAIKKQTANLSLTKKRRQIEYNRLLLIKKQRVGLLRTINASLKKQAAKLNKLVADKKALERIIAKLEAETISMTFATPLNKLHKKLHWPVEGRINYLYGRQISNSQLRWKGVVISAPEGRGVYAISTGKVVFAQWLRGYGLMLIINHGHGYMSLYGRNSILYKKTGDIVHTGDLIAAVGNSGGYMQTGLYFSIRHNGRSVNPRVWCRQ